jgi:hypothetical protein
MDGKRGSFTTCAGRDNRKFPHEESEVPHRASAEVLLVAIVLIENVKHLLELELHHADVLHLEEAAVCLPMGAVHWESNQRM